MKKEINAAIIEQTVEEVLAAFPGYFLVQVRIKPTNNIKVFVDGDQGITIETCIRLNRQIYAAIEEAGWYPDGDYSLEVSSPGVGEPLRLHRQYIKNVGRRLRVQLHDETELTGELKAVTDNSITLEQTFGKGKKAVKQLQELDFNNIKTASVEVIF